MSKVIRIIDRRVKEKFMIDDIYLNGYARLCGWKASLVYFSLCRHVNVNQYCFPSVKLMAEEHSVSRDVIMDGIKILVRWNIIEVTKNKSKSGWKNNTYTLLDKSIWIPKPSHVADSDSGKRVSEDDSVGSQEQPDHIAVNDTKETHKKGNTSKETHTSNASVAGVEDIMKIFYQINPTLNGKNKTTRRAAADLIEQFGLKETIRMAEAAVSIQGQDYAPIITNPWELKEKLLKVKLYFDRQKNSKSQITSI